ncbi:MAG: peptide chain release factor N(5)-glutamine methyltransferase [Balneolales bacterium]
MSQSLENWSVVKMLNWGTDYFKEKNIISPRLSIEWLLSDVLGIKRLDLYMQFDRPLTKGELAAIKPLILRRSRHEPLQYITGSTEFFNTVIKVNRDTLIPRPETEQLVEILLTENQGAGPLRVLDVGTGTGCIAIALKKERPEWEVIGMDISKEALKVAQTNSVLNELDITFIHGDLYNWEHIALDKGFDLVVSNPPYITEPERSSIEEQVIRYEPEMALFTKDIKSTYLAIAALSQHLLKSGGRLYLEANEHHTETLIGLFNTMVWKAESLKDYSNKNRFIRAFLLGETS